MMTLNCFRRCLRVSGKKIDNTKKNAPAFAQKYTKKRLNYDGVVREGIEPVNNTDLKNEGDKYDEIGTV